MDVAKTPQLAKTTQSDRSGQQVCAGTGMRACAYSRRLCASATHLQPEESGGRNHGRDKRQKTFGVRTHMSTSCPLTSTRGVYVWTCSSAMLFLGSFSQPRQ